MIVYCEAEHPNTNVGCYAKEGHSGKHWSYSSQVKDCTGERANDGNNWIWEWDNEAPEVPAGSATLVLNDAELGILLTTLDPVKQFFPDLSAKLIEVRRRLQK